MTRRLRDQVRRRAGYRCEYCLVPEAATATPAHVDHVRPRQHGGRTVISNLALACLHCNSRKGPNLTGIDPASGTVVALFNPREDRWWQHFRWNDAKVIGLTQTGRATVATLGFNEPQNLVARQALAEEGWFDDLT